MRKQNRDAQLLRDLKSAQDVSAKKLRQKLENETPQTDRNQLHF